MKRMKQQVVLDVWDRLVGNTKPRIGFALWALVKGDTLPRTPMDQRTLTIGMVNIAAVEELARG